MRTRSVIFLLILLNLAAVAVNICYGSIHIPLEELLEERWHFIVWESRMPAAITALLTGSALAYKVISAIPWQAHQYLASPTARI